MVWEKVEPCRTHRQNDFCRGHSTDSLVSRWTWNFLLDLNGKGHPACQHSFNWLCFTRIAQPNRAPAGVQVSASLMRSFRNLPHRHHPRAKPAGFNDPLLVWERRLANDWWVSSWWLMAYEALRSEHKFTIACHGFSYIAFLDSERKCSIDKSRVSTFASLHLVLVIFRQAG